MKFRRFRTFDRRVTSFGAAAVRVSGAKGASTERFRKCTRMENFISANLTK